MTQEAIEKRIKAAGYKDPDTYVLEQGYCRSVYIKDPNGMLLEFTLDAPNADEIAKGSQGGCASDSKALAQRRSRVEQYLSVERDDHQTQDRQGARRHPSGPEPWSAPSRHGNQVGPNPRRPLVDRNLEESH